MKAFLQFTFSTAILLGVFFQQTKSQSFESLDINNIKAGFSSTSAMFYDQVSGPNFEVPKGSGKHTVFAGNLWIGGLNNGALHFAGEWYRGYGNDFFPGPIMNTSAYSTLQDAYWNRVWKVDWTMISNHIANFSNPGYIMPQVFIDWPAHGNVSLGQSYYLAPFFDFDQDGTYDPYQGDYPSIKGDQAVFFLFNDDRDIHQTGGTKLGIEVHAMAYAFNCAQDSALDHSIFLNYKIFNRSVNSYDSTYFGTWLDMDIGFPSDDFVGSDVQRGSFYTYNGVAEDGTGGPSHYGLNPPAQSCVILKGPLQDADGTDNAVGIGANESLNGYGFGDGIPDNESLGMSYFMYTSSTGGNTSASYYNNLRGRFSDGTPNYFTSGSDTIECNYMFPGNSDPLGWGTGGVPYPGWSEITVENVPFDRRGLMSTGPFTFASGSMQSYDLAFVFGRDYDSTSGGSIVIMNQRIDDIRAMFVADLTPCGTDFGLRTSIENHHKIKDNLLLYPNPANEQIIIEFVAISNRAYYEIYDITGRLAAKGNMESSGQNTILLQGLDEGLFILKITDGTSVYKKKFVKMSR
ncbi:MAG: T9SS type A sorting domain-containing protein [Bacteroidota bacterium]|nr:T9SS type A sorting domain-containing protein [Bacteroidota bacterium]